MAAAGEAVCLFKIWSSKRALGGEFPEQHTRVMQGSSACLLCTLANSTLAGWQPQHTPSSSRHVPIVMKCTIHVYDAICAQLVTVASRASDKLNYLLPTGAVYLLHFGARNAASSDAPGGEKLKPMGGGGEQQSCRTLARYAHCHNTPCAQPCIHVTRANGRTSANL